MIYCQAYNVYHHNSIFYKNSPQNKSLNETYLHMMEFMEKMRTELLQL